jgi:hypothetical protein
MSPLSDIARYLDEGFVLFLLCDGPWPPAKITRLARRYPDAISAIR